MSQSKKLHKQAEAIRSAQRAIGVSTSLLPKLISPLELAEKFGQVPELRAVSSREPWWKKRNQQFEGSPFYRRQDQTPWWKRARLPLLGLRNQTATFQGRLQSKGATGRSNLRKVPGTRTICETRSARRQILFRLGIAGKGRRNSPGSGGTYRRTPDSYYHCTTIRK